MTMPSPIEEPTVTVDRVAAILGISRSSAYDAVRAGQIPAIRIGHRWLVPVASLRKLVGLDVEAASSEVA